jgi:hypothetical protein
VRSPVKGSNRLPAPAEYPGEMTAAETGTFEETELIQAWRAEALERAGYTAAEAAEVAVRHDIDLHHAIGLLERGCPAELALQILL